jgi:hypothetical protein
MVVIMNTFSEIHEEIEIVDIPLNKWFHLLLRCRNKEFDVFINGMITKSIQLEGLPKQNYGDVNIAMNNGFNGNISNLWYYNYAMGTKAIFDLTQQGPNTNSKDNGMGALSIKQMGNFLSLRWYIGGMANDAHP